MSATKKTRALAGLLAGDSMNMLSMSAPPPRPSPSPFEIVQVQRKPATSEPRPQVPAPPSPFDMVHVQRRTATSEARSLVPAAATVASEQAAMLHMFRRAVDQPTTVGLALDDLATLARRLATTSSNELFVLWGRALVSGADLAAVAAGVALPELWPRLDRREDRMLFQRECETFRRAQVVDSNGEATANVTNVRALVRSLLTADTAFPEMHPWVVGVVRECREVLVADDVAVSYFARYWR